MGREVAKFNGDKISESKLSNGRREVAKLQGDKSASQSSMELYDPTHPHFLMFIGFLHPLPTTFRNLPFSEPSRRFFDMQSLPTLSLSLSKRALLAALHTDGEIPKGTANRGLQNICLKSALGKWGRTQMGSDRFNRILLFFFFSTVGVGLVPLKTHGFKGFRPDFNRILT